MANGSARGPVASPTGGRLQRRRMRRQKAERDKKRLEACTVRSHKLSFHEMRLPCQVWQSWYFARCAAKRPMQHLCTSIPSSSLTPVARCYLRDPDTTGGVVTIPNHVEVEKLAIGRVSQRTARTEEGGNVKECKEEIGDN
jgi:hypothetical protein